MKKSIGLIYILTFLLATTHGIAQVKDTLTITPKNLLLNNLKPGKSNYIVYIKKAKNSPAERITLVKINVETKFKNNRPIIAITQQWELDTVVHTAYTELNAADGSTLEHEYYWKRWGYAAKYNFEAKTITYDGPVTDSVKTNSLKDFTESFDHYNLNWHSDLIIFPLLPFKEDRVFKINFYDPGFGKAQEVYYSVIGTGLLNISSGEPTRCWVVENQLSSQSGYQRFWISQKTYEVLKEEDSFNGRFRYKLKTSVSEENP